MVGRKDRSEQKGRLVVVTAVRVGGVRVRPLESCAEFEIRIDAPTHFHDIALCFSLASARHDDTGSSVAVSISQYGFTLMCSNSSFTRHCFSLSSTGRPGHHTTVKQHVVAGR